MTESFTETPEAPTDSKMSIFAAILLGLAATLTALAAYNAALSDGESLQGYTESTAALSDSNYFYAQGNQTFAGDQNLFVQYASAAQSGDEELAAYLTTLMRPELDSAITWWQESEDASTPFDEFDENPYEIAEFAEAELKAQQSTKAFAAGSAADDRGDKFELATVLLALTLFFAGIATLFRRRPVSIALLGVGTVALVAGAIQLGVAFGA